MRDAEFDSLFEALVQTREPSAGRGEPPPAWDAEGAVRSAVALFYRGDYARSLAVLDKAAGAGAADPLALAFRGASRAFALGEVRAGLTACLEAVRRGFYLADVYCALGCVLLKAGERRKAHAAFRRGLEVDPSHGELTHRLAAMGRRRPPVLPFLARSHRLNRVLGSLRARLLPKAA